MRGISLSEGDEVVFAGQIGRRRARSSSRPTPGTAKKVILSQIDPMARYRKGVKIVDLGGKRRVVYADIVTDPYKVAVELDDGTLVQADTEEDRLHRGPHHQGEEPAPEKGVQACRLPFYEVFALNVPARGAPGPPGNSLSPRGSFFCRARGRATAPFCDCTVKAG